jgi:hypothetical protein
VFCYAFVASQQCVHPFCIGLGSAFLLAKIHQQTNMLQHVLNMLASPPTSTNQIGGQGQFCWLLYSDVGSGRRTALQVGFAKIT